MRPIVSYTVGRFMNEAVTGIVVLIGVSVLCALIAHALIRHLLVAAAVAAPVASLLVLIAETVHLGYMDPFAPLAFMPIAGLAFGIAVLVGLPFHLRRRHAGLPSDAEEQDQPRDQRN